jgi:hypothetical protein
MIPDKQGILFPPAAQGGDSSGKRFKRRRNIFQFLTTSGKIAVIRFDAQHFGNVERAR